MIHNVLRNLVLAQSAISDLVGTRFYPIVAAQGAAFPHMVYSTVSTPRGLTYAGADGLAHPRWQVDVYSNDYDQAKLLAALVTQALHTTSGTYEGTRIDLIQLDNETDSDFEPDPNTFRVILDFIVHYEE
jgi:hypothetical protein